MSINATKKEIINIVETHVKALNYTNNIILDSILKGLQIFNERRD